VERATEYLASDVTSPRPRTAEEYFTILLGRAVQAVQAGDYGISAALVTQYGDAELVSFGRNTMISRSDPFGHAEANAIHYLRQFSACTRSERAIRTRPWTDVLSVAHSEDKIFSRPKSAAATPSSILYCTVEPCPMCTVLIINSHVESVVIATPDRLGGALAPTRLGRLPSIWPKLVASQGIQVRFSTGGRAEEPATYIPAMLSSLLSAAWRGTKNARDNDVLSGAALRMNGNIAASELLRQPLTRGRPQ
jgi:tRNA(Arg) A34 adenosine deaminase TadA